MLPGLFITGTNTGVGKTFVSCQIAAACARRGVRVGVYKPVLSGCPSTPQGELAADDAVQLLRAAQLPNAARGGAPEGEPWQELLQRVAPQRFSAPLAPHLAAQAESRQLDSRLLREGIAYWRAHSDLVIVEGAGGLLSPLGDDEYVADLAADLAYPLVIVAANQLGVIGQTLLALHAARTFRRKLNPVAVVLNDHVPRAAAGTVEPDPSVYSNAAQLRIHCRGVLVTESAHGTGEFSPPVDWLRLAQG